MKKIEKVFFSFVFLLLLSGCNLLDDGSVKKVDVIIAVEDDNTQIPVKEVVTAQVEENYLQVKGENFLSLKPDSYKVIWKVKSKLETDKDYTYEIKTYDLKVGEDKKKLYIKIYGDQVLD